MVESVESPPSVRFGPFEFDLRTTELRKHGRKIRLRGQPAEILALLLERPGQLVSRELIRTRLWPGDTFVEFDHSLNAAINKLRECLGDSASKAQFVETVPRRGYRFIGQVQPVIPAESEIPQAPQAPPVELPKRNSKRLFAVAVLFALPLIAVGAWVYTRRFLNPSPHITSLAVLPLENLSNDPEQEYFADGVTEELITELGRISALRVISRTSVMRFKRTKEPLPKIARELGVDALVEGTVLLMNDRLRVTANLVQAQPERHIWAQTYERDLVDVLGIQSDVAEAIARQIQVRLTPAERLQLAKERPVNPAAHEAYLKGRFHWNKRTEGELRTGIEYFNQAIAADPQYALAYVGLADSYHILGSWVFTAVPSHEAKSQELAYIRKALEIDDSLGEAHTSLANAKLLFDCDWKGSEEEFKRAIALSPNYANAHHWYAELLIDIGRDEESIRESYKAKQLDPFAPMMTAGLAQRLLTAGRVEDAIRETHNALELDPNLPLAHRELGREYQRLGKFSEAIAEFQRAAELSGNNPNFVAELAYSYAVSGDRSRAQTILKELQNMSRSRYVAPYQIAAAYSGLGEKRKALDSLKEAYKEQSPWLNNLYRDDRFESVRREPEFVGLLKTLHFPDREPIAAKN